MATSTPAPAPAPAPKEVQPVATAVEDKKEGIKNPDGSYRPYDPVYDDINAPDCPPVNLTEGPFDTTSIPAGLNQPLSQKCADYYNAKLKAQTKK